MLAERVGAPAFGARPARPADRALGRPGPTAPREGRADPFADADRPRGDGRCLAASARRRGARRAPRARARRARVRPGGGGLPAWSGLEILALDEGALGRGMRSSHSSRRRRWCWRGRRSIAALAAMGELRRPGLAVSRRPLGRRRRACGRGCGRCGIDAVGVTAIRRAGLVHDLGRVAVHPRIWQKPGPLTADEWEQVRLHPYHTERVLSRSPFLAALARSRPLITSGSTGPAITAGRRRRRSGCRPDCSPPPTPTTR